MRRYSGEYRKRERWREKPEERGKASVGDISIPSHLTVVRYFLYFSPFPFSQSSPSPPLLSSPPPSTLSLPHHDVSMETEGEPVGEHSLSHRLCSPQEELWVGLGHCPANQLTQESTEDSAGGKEMTMTVCTADSQHISSLFIHFRFSPTTLGVTSPPSLIPPSSVFPPPHPHPFLPLILPT